jgi:hypothetical protein
MRQWGAGGWRGSPPPGRPFRGAYIAYAEDGVVYVGDIGTIGGP